MNWIELKALNTVHVDRVVKVNETLIKSGVFNYLIASLKVLEQTHKGIIVLPDFTEVYETRYKEKYSAYHLFLNENNLLKPQIRFHESDINILQQAARFVERQTTK